MPLSWLYGVVVKTRNTLFEMGVLKSRSFKIPIISVGNITVGGTGKTPHVEYMVRLLKDQFHVAVLSRGYKRKSKGFIKADNQIFSSSPIERLFVFKLFNSFKLSTVVLNLLAIEYRVSFFSTI